MKKDNDTFDLDGTLARWPATGSGFEALRGPVDVSDVIEDADSRHWERRAGAIMSAVLASGTRPKDEAVLSALVEAPMLEPEAGEPASIAIASGENKMSESVSETSPVPADASEEPPPAKIEATPPPSVTPRPRTSLREMAQRASQSGARPSFKSNPAATPIPSAVATPIPSIVSAATSPTATPLPNARASSPSLGEKAARAAQVKAVMRAAEASSSDSGFVDLGAVNAAATPEQKAAAEAAKPGAADLFDEEAPGSKKGAAPASKRAAAVAALPAAAAAAPAPQSSSKLGMVIGLGIAAVGLAAAFMIVQKNRVHAPADNAPVSVEAKGTPPAKVDAPTTAAPTTPPPSTVATAEPAATDPDSLPDKAAPQQKVALGAGTAPAQAPDKAAPPDNKAATPPAPDKTSAPSSGKPDDLATAMQKAAGDQNKKSDTPDNHEQASGGNKGNQAIPEEPSQGSVSAAILSVMAGAKACVAGADDVSRAQVTFGSSGAVTNVSVTGWAASNGKSGCVQAALKGAKVGAFSKASFTAGVTIRADQPKKAPSE